MSRPRRQQEKETPAPETQQNDVEAVRTCPECAAESLVMSADDDEIICEECGLVIEEDHLDRGPEWRAYTHGERQRKSRVGSPITQRMHDKGLTTQIDWQDKDAYGNALSGPKRRQMRRLRKWQERIRVNDVGERSLQFALSEIDRMASALGIPDSVREVASVIYRRTYRGDLISRLTSFMSIFNQRENPAVHGGRGRHVIASG